MAASFIGEDGQLPANIHVRVYPRGGQLRELHCCDPHRDPMIYPILFPYGELGKPYTPKFFT